MALLNRNLHPPGGGFTFVQPETHWRLPGGLPFHDTVLAIIKHRSANPAHKLATEYDVVAEELDAFTCLRLENDPRWCTQKKTTADLSLEIPPKSEPVKRNVAVADRIHEVVVGSETLMSWLGAGLKPVSDDTANARAAVCAFRPGGKKCPNNVDGSFLDKVTGVIGKAIHAAMEAKEQMDLRTSFDGRLGTCDACGCHLKLKVWAPPEHVKDNLDDDARARLDPQCWILSL